MSDLKVVLYKGNHAPRALAISTRLVYRLLLLASAGALLLVLSLAISLRLYVSNRAKTAHPAAAPAAESEEEPPAGSLEAQIRALKDEADQLAARLRNQQALATAAREIDKTNPALALFPPTVTDRTKEPDRISLRNFKVSSAGNGKGSTTLSFELHNPQPGKGAQKGYIVVLGRAGKTLFAYPEAFTASSPYLVDFEKGETFSIARFRMVNAQFDLPFPVDSFQILIFTRSGELLVNLLHEAEK